jgi:1-acyl-sn-glycerol-3-phosphate acyltransferase
MFATLWAKMAVSVNPFWRVHIEGRENLEKGKPYIFVSNHQSNFDILILFQIYRFFKWISKIEVLKFPFVGWGLRMNRYVYFDRKNPKSRAEVLKKCKEWLEKGVSLFFFPEGTRSRDGELRKFKPGAFQLAIEEKIPLVPIAIQGSRDILGKHKLLLSAKADIHIQIMEPISMDRFTPEDLDKLIDQTRRKIGEFLEKKKV